MVFDPDNNNPPIPPAPAAEQPKSEESLMAPRKKRLEDAAKRAQELGLRQFPTGTKEEEG